MRIHDGPQLVMGKRKCKADSDVGPLINQKAANKFLSLLEDATEKGAKILAGGKEPNDADQILFCS